MQIKIIDVTISEVPKKVGSGNNVQMSVTYENLSYGGKPDGKKLQQWATKPEVWEALSTATKGDLFAIVTEKNAKGYIDWLSVSTIEATDVVQTAVQAPARTGSSARAAKGEQVASTWDVKNKLDAERFEFEKKKQILIIRQSSLSTAVAFLANSPEATQEDVINTAKQFEAYVQSQGTN